MVNKWYMALFVVGTLIAAFAQVWFLAGLCLANMVALAICYYLLKKNDELLDKVEEDVVQLKVKMKGSSVV